MSLKDLDLEERKQAGIKLNNLSNSLKEKLELKRRMMKLMQIQEKEEKEFLDITIPSPKIERGHIHPLSLARKELEDIFTHLGLSLIHI